MYLGVKIVGLCDLALKTKACQVGTRIFRDTVAALSKFLSLPDYPAEYPDCNRKVPMAGVVGVFLGADS